MCPHFNLAAAFLDLLRVVPDVTVRLHDLGSEFLGETEFATRTISISPTVSLRGFRSTLAHEIVHLQRGPTTKGNEAHEEVHVEEQASRILVPHTSLPAILEAVDAHRIAMELGVDLATARLAIDLAMRERKEVA